MLLMNVKDLTEILNLAIHPCDVYLSLLLCSILSL